MKSYRKQILISAAIALIAGFAHAGDYCDQLPEKFRTIDMVNVSIRGSYENGDGFLVRSGKTLNGINQCQADYACKQLGARLPTARELAIEGRKHGAEMVELSPDSPAPKDFYLVIVVNPNGKKDQFYYRYENYAIPAGDLGNYWMWSSSVHPYYDDVYPFFLVGYSGRFDSLARDWAYNVSAARCVSSGGVNH
jgi:hypothetical protein